MLMNLIIMIVSQCIHIPKHQIVQAKYIHFPQSMEFSKPEYWSGQLLQNLPNPGTESRSPAMQVDSLLSEPPRKPKNTGMGSLSLLQRIFPTQELNQSLLYCRQILYRLSYQGSPSIIYYTSIKMGKVNQHVKSKTTKLLGENVGNYCLDRTHKLYFIYMTF